MVTFIERQNYAELQIWCYYGESDTYNVGNTSGNILDRVEEFTFAEEAVGTVQMVHDAYRKL